MSEMAFAPPKIDVTEAIQIAKAFLQVVFADEKITNVGLEEVTEELGVWSITLGFSRPWDDLEGHAFHHKLEYAARSKPLARTYKVVKVDGERRRALSVSNRDFDLS